MKYSATPDLSIVLPGGGVAISYYKGVTKRAKNRRKGIGKHCCPKYSAAC